MDTHHYHATLAVGSTAPDVPIGGSPYLTPGEAREAAHHVVTVHTDRGARFAPEAGTDTLTEGHGLIALYGIAPEGHDLTIHVWACEIDACTGQ